MSKQLGHTDIKTTLDFYVRWLPPMNETEIDKLNAARNASPMRHSEADNV